MALEELVFRVHFDGFLGFIIVSGVFVERFALRSFIVEFVLFCNEIFKQNIIRKKLTFSVIVGFSSLSLSVFTLSDFLFMFIGVDSYRNIVNSF